MGVSKHMGLKNRNKERDRSEDMHALFSSQPCSVKGRLVSCDLLKVLKRH